MSTTEQAVNEADDTTSSAATSIPLTPTVSDEPPSDLAAEETYNCPTCASSWSYRIVRNTGRCPTCGGGLRRSRDDAE